MRNMTYTLRHRQTASMWIGIGCGKVLVPKYTRYQESITFCSILHLYKLALRCKLFYLNSPLESTILNLVYYNVSSLSVLTFRFMIS